MLSLLLLLLLLLQERDWPGGFLGGAGRGGGRCWLQLRQQQEHQGPAMRGFPAPAVNKQQRFAG